MTGITPLFSKGNIFYQNNFLIDTQVVVCVVRPKSVDKE